MKKIENILIFMAIVYVAIITGMGLKYYPQIKAHNQIQEETVTKADCEVVIRPEYHQELCQNL